MKKAVPIIAVALVVVLAAVFLVACAPSNVEKAKENLKKEGYIVVGYQRQSEGVVGGIVATKLTSTMTAVLYDKASTARADLKEIKKENPDTNAKVMGKWIVWGDEAAIKAFKG